MDTLTRTRSAKRQDVESISKILNLSKENSSIREQLLQKGILTRETAEIISFMMCKGGVGKTTSTFFLGLRLASLGVKVLFVDLDPQGNLTSAFHLDHLKFEVDEETPVFVDLVTEQSKIFETIIAVTPEVHLIPSTVMNSNLETRLKEKFRNPSVPIRRILNPVLSNYDFVLIDCAPTLNLTNTAAICAADRVVFPVNPDQFAIQGLKQTLNEVSLIEEDFNFEVKKRIIFSKFDRREKTSNNYLRSVKEKYNEILYKTVIRTSTEYKNAITKNKDLFAAQSNAKDDFNDLVVELLLDR